MRWRSGVSQASVELPLVEAGRAAAFLITNAEGGALHLDDLRRRAGDFEPLSRDRFLAGALLPAAWIARAQRVRRLYAEAVAAPVRALRRAAGRRHALRGHADRRREASS